jgi:hypothetical protein
MKPMTQISLNVLLQQVRRLGIGKRAALSSEMRKAPLDFEEQR